MSTTTESYTLRQSDSYKPTPRQKDFGAELGREIRDRLTAAGATNAPSASSLAKYYPIERLKAALAVLRAGGTVVVE